MIKKHLQKKLSLSIDDSMANYPDVTKFEEGSSRPLELEYFLLESSSELPDESDKSYGIGISLKVNETCHEEKYILDFSNSIDKAQKTINLLAVNHVTPVGLQPVIEDLLGI